jgi:hypothetical protein
MKRRFTKKFFFLFLLQYTSFIVAINHQHLIKINKGSQSIGSHLNLNKVSQGKKIDILIFFFNVTYFVFLKTRSEVDHPLS